jgi:pteridine reductase
VFNQTSTKVALITGAARRIGATIARTFHTAGFNVIIHYRHSQLEAQALADELNLLRANSVKIIAADLAQLAQIQNLAEQAVNCWSKVSVLINNASSFYRTPLENSTEADWETLMASNLKAPFFLSQSLAKHLELEQGSIVNITDIHADRPLRGYPIYSIAKAGLAMLTKSLAKELGPKVRVNAVAPGAVLWPEQANALDQAMQEKIIHQTILKRHGRPEDIASAALFLAQADYITGQVLVVDGGRTLSS